MLKQSTRYDWVNTEQMDSNIPAPTFASWSVELICRMYQTFSPVWLCDRSSSLDSASQTSHRIFPSHCCFAFIPEMKPIFSLLIQFKWNSPHSPCALVGMYGSVCVFCMCMSASALERQCHHGLWHTEMAECLFSFICLPYVSLSLAILIHHPHIIFALLYLQYGFHKWVPYCMRPNATTRWSKLYDNFNIFFLLLRNSAEIKSIFIFRQLWIVFGCASVCVFVA